MRFQWISHPWSTSVFSYTDKLNCVMYNVWILKVPEGTNFRVKYVLFIHFSTFSDRILANNCWWYNIKHLWLFEALNYFIFPQQSWLTLAHFQIWIWNVVSIVKWHYFTVFYRINKKGSVNTILTWLVWIACSLLHTKLSGEDTGDWLEWLSTPPLPISCETHLYRGSLEEIGN